MRSLALSILVLLCLVTPALGQEKPKGFAEFNAFLDKPREGWEWDEDERLDDLLMQLQEKELALQAVDLRTARLQGKKGSAKMDERMAWRAVDRMDLNAGGPVRWDAFYGRNAENFFYHPVDRNTTYHTTTVLQQVQPTSAGGVPGNQGVPAHQRPPQFDYIYRGYERRQAKAKEEASEITNKLEILQDRRRQLEEEVILLWTKIAFRVLDRDKVAEKPVLRWASLPVNGDNKEDSERAVAFNEATHLLAVGLLFNEQQVESEAEKVFSTVGTAIQTNRRNFEDSLLRAGVLLDDSEDKTKPIGQYKFLSRKLEDVSKSLSEGYRGWRDGDENDDEPTKFVGLRRVQDSVVTYAKILLALNELVDVMKKDWGLRVNPDSTEFVPKWDVAYTARVTNTRPLEAQKGTHTSSADKLPGQGSGKDSRSQKTTSLLGLVNTQRDALQGNWIRQSNGVVATDGGEFVMVRIPCNAPQFYDVTVSFRKRGVGLVTVCIPTGRTQAMVTMNVGDRSTKIEFVDGKGAVILDKPLFGPNERCTVTIKVRENSIQLMKGDLVIAGWQGSFDRLSYYDRWPRGVPPRGFGLGTCRDPVEFYEVELRAVE